MVDFGDSQKPELKEYSLENWGFMLRDSASLSPDVFPHKVTIPKSSTFFRSAYNRVYKGESAAGKRAIKNKLIGRFVEHIGIMGVSDIGELMISQEVFEGNVVSAVTKKNSQDFVAHSDLLRKVSLPAGWRTIGIMHSHPVDDIAVEAGLLLAPSVPKIYGIPVTWSGADYNTFIEGAKYGYKGETAAGLISQNLISFMVSSKETTDRLKDADLNRLMVKDWWLPDYKKLEDLGIVLYAGIHDNLTSDNVDLRRLM